MFGRSSKKVIFFLNLWLKESTEFQLAYNSIYNLDCFGMTDAELKDLSVLDIFLFSWEMELNWTSKNSMSLPPMFCVFFSARRAMQMAFNPIIIPPHHLNDFFLPAECSQSVPMLRHRWEGGWPCQWGCGHKLQTKILSHGETPPLVQLKGTPGQVLFKEKTTGKNGLSFDYISLFLLARLTRTCFSHLIPKIKPTQS